MESTPIIAFVLLAALWVAAAAYRPAATANTTRFFLRSPVTLIHEMSHAVFATVTGGLATGIRLASAGEATVKTMHFTIVSRLFTPAAGYTLAPVVGLTMMMIARWVPGGAQGGLLVIGAVGALSFLLSRNLLALGASAWMMALGLTMTYSGIFSAMWVGLAVVLIATAETVVLVSLHIRHKSSEIETDATIVSFRIIPPVIVAVCWLAMNLVVVAAALAVAFL